MKINIENFADGAFSEKLNDALIKVAENIQDPNTDPTAKRAINGKEPADSKYVDHCGNEANTCGSY